MKTKTETQTVLTIVDPLGLALGSVLEPLSLDFGLGFARLSVESKPGKL